MPLTNSNSKSLNFIRIAAMIIFVATAWVFSEWLFFATKPSFMSLYPLWEKIGLLCGTALIMTVALLLVSIPFIAIGWLINKFTENQVAVTIMVFFPSVLLLAMTLLLLFDNFTLTLLGWGIRNAQESGAWAYRILVIVLTYNAGRFLHHVLQKPEIDAGMKVMARSALLIVVMGFPLIIAAISLAPGETEKIAVTDKDWPNILILSSDGVWAEHMSLYGYERPTTSFMDSVQDEFLIAENHFSNASDTGGSVVSLLNGKLPTSTRVVYPPDVLHGRDSFQHLPGILKKLGYYNADISMRHYADPYDLNMRGGFAEANFRKLKDTGGTLVALIRQYQGLNPTSLFTDRISERLSQRFGRIAKDKPMFDPLAEVNTPEKRFIRDDARMVEIHRFIDESQQPFFLHVHMMGTHGSRFKPRERFYSTEESYPLDWSKDGYDDAIVDFDRYVQETYGLLKKKGILDSTIFIISSDHGFNHNPLHRVPMMLRMPGQTRSGFLAGNTQRLDIAPTLLEAIGIAAPDWMEGSSMLSSDVDELSTRPIFASGSSGEKSSDGTVWSVSNPQPPWYSLGRLSLVKCNQGFILLTNSMELEETKIPGSTLNCPVQITLDDARQLMLEHLKVRGYQPDT